MRTGGRERLSTSLDRAQLEALLERAPGRRPLSSVELRATALRLFGPSGLTEKQTTFTEPELQLALTEAHVQGAPAERIRALCERLLRLDGVEPVGEEAGPGRPGRYTTSELVGVERAALALVEGGRKAGAPVVHPGTVERVVAPSRSHVRLGDDQEAMLRAVSASPDRVVCVVGRAGTGKTSATRAVAEALRAEGIPVFGAAPSGAAAERLQEAGIASTTLHRLLLESERSGGLPCGSVLVVDEAAMAETRILARVIELVQQAEGKAILIGDTEQLPAVGAGGLFAAIVERHGALELTENRRQVYELEQRALEAVRSGAGEEYLAFAAKRERLVVCDDPLEARLRLLADWWQAAQRDLSGNVMIALRRRDVAELNQGARALMERAERLGDDRLEVGGREYATGDRIVCLQNSDSLGVKNGTRGTIDRVDLERRTLLLRSDRGDLLTLPSHYLAAGRVRHGYALTGHASQGLTVQRAFVLGTGGGELKEWGYVALSRARQATRLYLTASEVELDTHGTALDPPEPTERFARALEASGAERLASEQRPPSLNLRSGKGSTSVRLQGLERQRRITEHQRAQARQRLAAAEQELGGLGLLARRRRGPTLRSEIALQRSALTLADKRLAELERHATAVRARDARPRAARSCASGRAVPQAGTRGGSDAARSRALS